MFYLDVFRRNERQRPEEAERDFRLALSLSNDSDPGAWRGMGYLYLFRGQRHDALMAFRKCVLLTNNHPSYDVKEQIEILERFPR
jgi:Flp pilus assembly protein TadD